MVIYVKNCTKPNFSSHEWHFYYISVCKGGNYFKSGKRQVLVVQLYLGGLFLPIISVSLKIGEKTVLLLFRFKAKSKLNLSSSVPVRFRFSSLVPVLVAVGFVSGFRLQSNDAQEFGEKQIL